VPSRPGLPGERSRPSCWPIIFSRQRLGDQLAAISCRCRAVNPTPDELPSAILRRSANALPAPIIAIAAHQAGGERWTHVAPIQSLRPGAVNGHDPKRPCSCGRRSCRRPTRAARTRSSSARIGDRHFPLHRIARSRWPTCDRDPSAAYAPLACRSTWPPLASPCSPSPRRSPIGVLISQLPISSNGHRMLSGCDWPLVGIEPPPPHIRSLGNWPFSSHESHRWQAPRLDVHRKNG